MLQSATICEKNVDFILDERNSSQAQSCIVVCCGMRNISFIEIYEIFINVLDEFTSQAIYNIHSL